MSEYEEVEQYRQLLEDWKPSAPPRREPFRAASSAPTARPVATSATSRVSAVARAGAVSYAPGAILLLNQRMVAIYRRAVPEKEYHIVLLLCPNDALKVQGMALDGYEVEELGNVAPQFVDQMQNEMNWNRDLLVFHCYSYEDACKIPAGESMEEPHVAAPATPPSRPAASAPETEARPAEPQNGNGHLRRGQRLHIKFGSNSWEAVYWGKDDQGQVIAHRTYENWSLMHLDLKRFENGLIVEPEIDLALVQDIEQSLLNG